MPVPVQIKTLRVNDTFTMLNSNCGDYVITDCCNHKSEVSYVHLSDINSPVSQAGSINREFWVMPTGHYLTKEEALVRMRDVLSISDKDSHDNQLFELLFAIARQHGYGEIVDAYNKQYHIKENQ